jgi:ribosomal protein L11 methylase PrmA
MPCVRARPDVIVANISPETIARLAPELLRCLRPGGVALVSGFERHEAAAVEAGAGAVRRRALRGSLQERLGAAGG